MVNLFSAMGNIYSDKSCLWRKLLTPKRPLHGKITGERKFNVFTQVHVCLRRLSELGQI